MKDKENRGGKEYWRNVSVRLKTEVKKELQASPHEVVMGVTAYFCRLHPQGALG